MDMCPEVVLTAQLIDYCYVFIFNIIYIKVLEHISEKIIYPTEHIFLRKFPISEYNFKIPIKSIHSILKWHSLKLVQTPFTV